MESVHFSKITPEPGFWSRYLELVRSVTVPAVYTQFHQSGRFDALRCRGDLPAHIYWDSDVAKWIEAAAYLLQLGPDPQLEAKVDEAVEHIVRNQLPDGYYNSYYISRMPEKRFTVRDHHELYCAGHLIEAAIAYDRATGKDAFLQAMRRYADLIYRVFYEEKSAAFFTPGHQQIELALLKLAEYTGIAKYRQLAAYFLEQRGRHPEEVCPDPEDSAGSSGAYYRWLTQSAEPVRRMTQAYGHAVRAGYLYTAMAELARQTGDRELLQVCRGLFRDIRDTKLSITGGVGAQLWGEAFGLPYRLDSRQSYNETCAAIALVLFAEALQRQQVCSSYGDVIERILFNGMLCGMSLEGDAFFYENPMEIDLRDYDLSTRAFDDPTPAQCHERGLLHSRRLRRAKLFTCSCCPPNIARMLASVTRSQYTLAGSTVYCHQFIPSTAELTLEGRPARLRLETAYPCDGVLRFTYHGPDATLAVRIPDWCRSYTGATEQGYARFPVHRGSVIRLELPMAVQFLEADPRVSELAGKCAVTRGPLVYCLESIDNGPGLWDLELSADAPAAVIPDERFGAPLLEMSAFRRPRASGLYGPRDTAREQVTARLIPYFAFANRELCDMQIWTRVR